MGSHLSRPRFSSPNHVSWASKPNSLCLSFLIHQMGVRWCLPLQVCAPGKRPVTTWLFLEDGQHLLPTGSFPVQVPDCLLSTTGSQVRGSRGLLVGSLPWCVSGL